MIKYVLFILLFSTLYGYGQRMSLSSGVTIPIHTSVGADCEINSLNNGQYLKGGTSYFFNERSSFVFDLLFQKNKLEWTTKGYIGSEIKSTNYDVFVLMCSYKYKLVDNHKFNVSISSGAGLVFNFNDRDIEIGGSLDTFNFKRKPSFSIGSNAFVAYFPKRYLGLFVEVFGIYSYKKVYLVDDYKFNFTYLSLGVGFGILFGG
ncbi:hypothetical protein K4L44_01450 [Halosquirtibacter laminarini]|uniref:Uncharacterized protein n=1 Tax=Halosquirtibacter laminarini TaxID=3374600 RepID=A0AC61NJV3_9BACT|nr:hypothetical protein K4L44_01450 [Prolixibacteraceae bacterium]